MKTEALQAITLYGLTGELQYNIFAFCQCVYKPPQITNDKAKKQTLPTEKTSREVICVMRGMGECWKNVWLA